MKKVFLPFQVTLNLLELPLALLQRFEFGLGFSRDFDLCGFLVRLEELGVQVNRGRGAHGPVGIHRLGVDVESVQFPLSKNVLPGLSEFEESCANLFVSLKQGNRSLSICGDVSQESRRNPRHLRGTRFTWEGIMSIDAELCSPRGKLSGSCVRCFH